MCLTYIDEGKWYSSMMYQMRMLQLWQNTHLDMTVLVWMSLLKRLTKKLFNLFINWKDKFLNGAVEILIEFHKSLYTHFGSNKRSNKSIADLLDRLRVCCGFTNISEHYQLVSLTTLENTLWWLPMVRLISPNSTFQ